MSTNPFTQHTNNLFANRGCDIDAAVAYAQEVITALPAESQIHATTALMVVINTASRAVDQINQSRSPERLALIELINELIAGWADKHLDARIGDWVEDNLDIEDKINDWMSNNFDVTDYNVNDAIDEWMGSNLEDRINDLDLVVRVR